MGAERYVDMLWLFLMGITGMCMIISVMSFMFILYRLIYNSGVLAVAA